MNTENTNNNVASSKNSLGNIFLHDIEVASFIIAFVVLATTISSYAFSAVQESVSPSYVIEKGNVIRNPVSVEIRDMNNDNKNDIVITHENNIREIIWTR
jgi:hypothetical protein